MLSNKFPKFKGSKTVTVATTDSPLYNVTVESASAVPASMTGDELTVAVEFVNAGLILQIRLMTHQLP